MDTVPDRVEQSVRARGLFQRGERILVAVSGGVDSMALLHALHGLASRHGWRLVVAHFNHRLRGHSSNADERLVRRTARALGLPCVAGSADVRAAAAAAGVSIEMAARQSRHRFLARAAAARGIRRIALAHHADDQVELFFLRLLRGTGGEGLAGMKWTAPSPAAGGVRVRPGPRVLVVRPMLDLAKRELERFALRSGIAFRDDASNRRRDILRNRIRRELLPLIRRKYQPAIDRVVPRLMEIAGTEAEAVGELASKWLRGGARAGFDRLAVAVQRRCIQAQLIDIGIAPEFDAVERLRTAPGRPVAVAQDHSVVLEAGGRLRLNRTESVRRSTRTGESAKGSCLKTVLRGRNGRLEFGGLEIRWSIDHRKGPIPKKVRPGSEVFDADKVGSILNLRHWLPGDRFQPIGMPGPVKMQDLFTNAKIPRGQRHELVILANSGGEVVWVEKNRISERFKLSSGTNRRLHWRWKRL